MDTAVVAKKEDSYVKSKTSNLARKIGGLKTGSPLSKIRKKKVIS